ncbi:MAG: hypothetical protein LBG88_04620 [Christensenellaceae bacterium]|jgi:hypothetical protein|nr:hypothetical protein [Christensenellaceae bacterium]
MKPYDDYPVIDITGLSIDKVSRALPIVQLPNGNKAIFKSKYEYIFHFNEAVFSRLAKLVDVKATENDLATQLTHNPVPNWIIPGVLSAYDKQLDPKKSKLATFDCFLCNFDRFPSRIQTVDLDGLFTKIETNIATRGLTLAPDFKERFIENYLFSVLMSNSDHKHYRNLFFEKDDATDDISVTPYFDMERSTFTMDNLDLYLDKELDGVEEIRPIEAEIFEGYKSNIKTLRTVHKEVHDKFIDNCNKVDVKKLCDFNKQHLYKYARTSEKNVQKYSETLGIKLEKQIEKMKEF